MNIGGAACGPRAESARARVSRATTLAARAGAEGGGPTDGPRRKCASLRKTPFHDAAAMAGAAGSGGGGGGGAGSRLERLLALLETGRTKYARRTAAAQLGELAAGGGAAAAALVARLLPYLASSAFETRGAAAAAAGAAARAAARPAAATLCPGGVPEASAAAGDAAAEAEGYLTLRSLDLTTVLERGQELLASTGIEFELAIDTSKPKDARLREARRELRRQLGLDNNAEGDGKVSELRGTAKAKVEQHTVRDDIIADEDLDVASMPVRRPGDDGRVAAGNLVDSLATKKAVPVKTEAPATSGAAVPAGKKMSARERIMAKRKAAKAAGRVSGNQPTAKRQRVEPKQQCSAGGGAGPAAATANADAAAAAIDVEDPSAAAADGKAWPFTEFADTLVDKLFHPSWTHRHGAASALRDLLSAQAVSAHVDAPPPGEMLSSEDAAAACSANRAWLQDTACRLLCVLALDRFVDMAGDRLMAPVREAAAQALGAVAHGLRAVAPADVLSATRRLAVLHAAPDWKVRHAAMLGLKYLIAAAGASDDRVWCDSVYAAVVPSAMSALDDDHDDVQAAAAEALLAIAATDSVALLGEARASLAARLWAMLEEIDELASCALPVLQLLRVLYSKAGALAALGSGEDGLVVSVASLRPFLHHVASSVREQAAQCLQTVVAASEAEGELSWLRSGEGAALADALQSCLQALLCECCRTHPSTPVQDALRGAWRHIAAIGARAGALDAAASARLPTLLQLASVPPGAPLPLEPSLGGPVGSLVPLGEEGQRASMSMLMGATRLIGEALALVGTCSDAAHAALTEGLDSPLAAMRQATALVLAKALRAGIAGGATTTDGARARFLLSDGFVERLKAIVSIPVSSTCPAGNGTRPYAELVAPLARFRGSVGALLTAGPRAGLQFSDAVKAETIDVPTATQLSDGAAAMLDTRKETATMTMGQISALRDAKAVAAKLKGVIADLTAQQHSAHTGVLAACAAALLAGSAHGAAGAGAGKLALDGVALQVPLMSWLTCATNTEQRETTADALAALVICGSRQLAGVPKPVGMKLMIKLGQVSCADVGASAATVGPSSASLGGEEALRALVRALGSSVFEELPLLWKSISMPVKAPPGRSLPDAAALSYANAFHMAGVCAPALPECLHVAHAHPLISAAMACVSHPIAPIRSEAIRYLASTAACGALRNYTMAEVHLKLAAILGDAGDAVARRGAAAAVAAVVRALGKDAVPHVPLLLVPVLKRMSDPDEDVRELAGDAFSELAPLLAIARGVPAPVGVPADVVSRASEESRVLEQLLDNSSIEDAPLPFELKGFKLRSYQQDGVNWLSFLARFGLHGVLADDMGLGKTIQTICCLASSASAARAQESEGGPATLGPRPSLVVCPPTLVGHWAAELEAALGMKRGTPGALLTPLELAGAARERAALMRSVTSATVVVTSYDSMRADAEALSALEWDYVVLDEGHAIRNHKSKMAIAAKAVGQRARHRLLLSGTPIQNRAHEMWSLFDFLMPGFLGSHAQFHQRFGKPIMASRDPKNSGDEEAGAQALAKLHKQVMPFVMRRTKDEVLTDLPPKIIQDVYVDCSPLQVAMYDAVGKDATLGDAVEGEGEKAGAHVFQAIQYVRKLCTHPALVYDENVGAHRDALGGQSLRGRDGLRHAPKLLALADLLRQCGIGSLPTDGGAGESGSADSTDGAESAAGGARHRVLVFAQLKATLELVEKDLFQSGALPGVQWLRLDGTVAPKERFGVARRFNADPSIDVLLLSTSVGGLGLNLTSADTVIFLEHDWNPMRDMQAMDRAHRLGQKRSVSVYRLVTRRTLEERIMGIQRFKKHVADAVVNADNASMRSMDTGQLLDLFSIEGTGNPTGGGAAAGASDAQLAEAATRRGSKGGKGMQAMLGELEAMWEQHEYDEEIDTQAFVDKLK